jgi:LacI family transcriptional regulator
MAAEYFFERQFRQVAFAWTPPWPEMKPLMDAFLGRAAELGMSCHEFRFVERSRELIPVLHARRQKECLTQLDKVPKPIGLLTTGDAAAARYTAWATMAGIPIPDQVAILGRGTAESVCESCIPSVSSFAQNREAISRTACDLLANTRKRIGFSTKPRPLLREARKWSFLATSMAPCPRMMTF